MSHHWNANLVLMEHRETISTAQRQFLSLNQFHIGCVNAGNLHFAIKTSVSAVSWNCTLTISYLLGTLVCQTWWLQNGWHAPVRTSSYWFSVSSKQRKSHFHTVSSSAVKYRHQWSFTVCRCGKTNRISLAISPSIPRDSFLHLFLLFF